MNKDQLKGKVKTAEGKIQQEAGKLFGSTEQQGKGIAKQVAGKTQESIGDAEQFVKNVNKKP